MDFEREEEKIPCLLSKYKYSIKPAMRERACERTLLTWFLSTSIVSVAAQVLPFYLVFIIRNIKK